LIPKENEMSPLNRREFLKGAVLAGGAAAVGLAEGEASAASGKAFPKRKLGRAKENVSLLGFGLAPLQSSNTTFAAAESLIHSAIDQGVTYLDVSPDYGNAEDKLKPPLKSRRDEVFLVTKVNPDAQDRDGVQRQIERSLRRMGTDRVDAVHIHNLGDWDMDRLIKPDGALAGLKAARERGLLRYIGVSGHMRPHRFVDAIGTGEFDLAMMALNFADRIHYDFEGEVLPEAKRHGTAIVAMKVLGGAANWQYDGKTLGTLASYHARSIRYSLSLPGVACAVIGMSDEKELAAAIQVVKTYRPLPSGDREKLLQEGRRLAEKRGLYYGPVIG
jgi:predicted aldo/keto reductase-like oxidoreductase